MEESTEQCWGITKINTAKISYKWTIYNFSLCNQKTGEFIESPPFSSSTCKQYQWNLRLYPNGNTEATKDSLSFFIFLTSDKPNIKIHLKYSIINCSGEEVNVKKSDHHFRSPMTMNWGYTEFININDVFDKTKKILNNDTLTLCCYITAGIGSENFAMENPVELETSNSPNICRDLNTLLENKHLADVVLVCNGKELHAHKCVLGARSSVFLAMFNHDMKEKRECKVKISDFDVPVLTEMLRYIYTEEVQNIEQYSQDLLIIADKYALEGLKLKCETFLCNKISVDNAIEILTLSERHNCNKLKKQALNFIIAHGKYIVNSPEFESYKNSQPHNIMIDVFEAYLLK